MALVLNSLSHLVEAHLPCTLTFVELEEEYEHYIQEESDTPVQITKYCLGPGMDPTKPQNAMTIQQWRRTCRRDYRGCCNSKAYSSEISSRAKKVSQTFQILKGTTPIIHVGTANYREGPGMKGDNKNSSSICN